MLERLLSWCLSYKCELIDFNISYKGNLLRRQFDHILHNTVKVIIYGIFLCVVK